MDRLLGRIETIGLKEGCGQQGDHELVVRLVFDQCAQHVARC